MLQTRDAMRTFLLLILLLTSPLSASGEQPAKSLAILFVGNSLTYANDMPTMLERLLVESGYEARIEVLAYPNFGLQDHWPRRETRRAIRSGGWDYVVFQQGPSATEGRPSLLSYSKKFARLVRENGGEPALYMVWPSRMRFGDFDGVSESYRMAAESVSGVLLPVGAAWRAAWQLDSELALYGDDGFHPTRAGSLLAALVMFQRFTAIDPTTALRVPEGDPQADAFRLLTRAASQANRGLDADPDPDAAVDTDIDTETETDSD